MPSSRKSLHDINEYMRDQNAYDLFDSILQELATRQPKDPIDHMLRFLSKPHSAQGPLVVLVSRAPGSQHAGLAGQLAQQFNCDYISAGELLREVGQVDTFGLGGYAEDEKVAELVLARIKKAQEKMQGLVLEGFPRTRIQTSRLMENAVVPTHVLVLKASDEQIMEYNRKQPDSKKSPEDVLQGKLRMHACHNPSALEAYTNKTTVIDTVNTDAKQVYAEMVKAVRMQQRSKAPLTPPRIVLLGPRGAGAHEHASRLATRLGAVFVDAADFQSSAEPSSPSSSLRKSKTGTVLASEKSMEVASEASQRFASMELPNAEALAKKDKVGIVGVRLRQEDCTKQGWVLCNFPLSAELAEALAADEYLRPTRVMSLQASEETCLSRLRHLFIDPVTGKIWTSEPENPEIRRRVFRRPEDQPEAVQRMHEDYVAHIGQLLEILQGGGKDLGKCTEIPADGPADAVFKELVEFAERPPPLTDF
eukprot:TRINITY_DN8059_c0_g1_i1.p1 TRINITY_DN8059_c0_g1~~TRINITY_DN8059_c0_g1_i1.p1  ORF type:complete len:478 (-),score=152.19 TRINITY_DN8059_c0_g1_i1:193-1626(-)